jgi:hypothetical protein
MLRLLWLFLGLLLHGFYSRRDLLLENLALRQQLSLFQRRKRRPVLSSFDKLFWVAIQRVWPQWKNSLVLVTPETVVRWHRAGFRRYWAFRCRHHARRKPVAQEVRQLISQMVAENPTWGAPRIHGELLKLGFEVSERTVSRWMQKIRKDPQRARRWKAFLENHREALAAMDFFTVPTFKFGVLYCFFVIGHGRRRILHVGVTPHPTSFWTRSNCGKPFLTITSIAT